MYPQLRSNRYDQWSNGKVPGDKTVWQLDYRPEMRGFSYCYASGSPDGNEAYLTDLTSKPAVVLVGREAVDVDQTQKVGSTELTDATQLIKVGAWMIFERDEYFFADSNVSF